MVAGRILSLYMASLFLTTFVAKSAGPGVDKLHALHITSSSSQDKVP